MRKFFKENWIIFLSAIAVLIVGIIILLVYQVISNKNIKEVTYQNNYISFIYDDTWNIDNDTGSKVVLNHSNNGKIVIELITLEGNYKYYEIDDLLDELMYNISAQNETYNLIASSTASITKNNYSGYKLLYENGDNETLVVLAKSSDKMLLIYYESTNEYFDILLDSVENIIYNIDLVNDTIDLTYDLSLDTSSVEWENNDEIVINGTSTYSIANNNYLVEFNIPDNFYQTSLNSYFKFFSYKGLSTGSLSLNVSIYNRNIYEYIVDDGSTKSLYYNYNTYRENTDEYINFSEGIEKLECDSNAYVYKNSYTVESDLIGNYNREEVLLIYELDTSHIMVVTISGYKNSIPKSIIENIEITNITNYSSYVTSVIKDNYLVGTLTRYIDYSYEKVENITLKLPTAFAEIDKESNIYMQRYYATNYNEDNELYEYMVSYETISYDIESKVSNINSSFSKVYGEYNYLTNIGTVTINGKEFIEYDGGYTYLGGVFFTNVNRFYYYINKKVLFYELESSGYLVITITGNGSQISNDLIESLTNFEINVSDY